MKSLFGFVLMTLFVGCSPRFGLSKKIMMVRGDLLKLDMAVVDMVTVMIVTEDMIPKDLVTVDMVTGLPVEILNQEKIEFFNK